MRKNLIKHGNSYAMVIDKPILELLRITPDMELELTTNGDALVISPVRTKAHQEELRRVLKGINEKYRPAFKKLAE